MTPRLATLELQKCASVDDAVLGALSALPRGAGLELLNLTDCKALRAPRLVCARLRTLHLYNCLSLSALTLYCPALELLNLTHCAELAAIDLSCPKLATLLCAGCKRLPDAAMVHAIRTCGALRTVDTKACPLLSDATRAVVEELLQKPAADCDEAWADEEGQGTTAPCEGGVVDSDGEGPTPVAKRVARV